MYDVITIGKVIKVILKSNLLFSPHNDRAVNSNSEQTKTIH